MSCGENATPRRFGARVYPIPDSNRARVKQTVKDDNDSNDEYVIDDDRERFVDLNNDAAVAQAIRDSLAGNLQA